MSPESLDPIFVAYNAKIYPLYKGPSWEYSRAMAGSIEGQRRVLDPMRVDLCVPRVP